MAESEPGDTFGPLTRARRVKRRDGSLIGNAVKVFGNALIVERICSFLSSQDDFLDLRLVNHLFQREATKRLRRVHKHIELKTKGCIQKFPSCMKKGESLQLTPFPFSAFSLSLKPSLETLEKFGTLLGQDMERYYLQSGSVHYLGRDKLREISDKVKALLPRSPQLTELLFNNFYQKFLSFEDQQLLRNIAGLKVVRVQVQPRSDREWTEVTLKSEFCYTAYLTKQRASKLAAKLGISERQLRNWYTNRRYKLRKRERGFGRMPYLE